MSSKIRLKFWSLLKTSNYIWRLVHRTSFSVCSGGKWFVSRHRWDNIRVGTIYEVGQYTTPDHWRGTDEVAQSLIGWFGRTHNCWSQDIGLNYGHLADRPETTLFLWSLDTFWSMHYRLRPIEGIHFRFANFAPHFIRVQIFQIDFLLTPSILSASKYFRYSCRGQNELFSVSLSVIIVRWKNLNYCRRKKGTGWTMFNVALDLI